MLFADFFLMRLVQTTSIMNIGLWKRKNPLQRPWRFKRLIAVSSGISTFLPCRSVYNDYTNKSTDVHK